MYQAPARGWVEILFHMGKTRPSPSSTSAIHENAYCQIGSVALQEVDGPYDIYQMLYYKSILNQPREVRSFDILNVVQPDKPRLSFLILSANDDRLFLENRIKNQKVTKLACWAQYPHGIVLMPNAFSSFAIKPKK